MLLSLPPTYLRPLIFHDVQMGDEEEEKGPAVVKLISSDGYEFVIEREAAMVSGTIKNMLSSPGKPPSNPAAFFLVCATQMIITPSQ